MRVIYFAGCGAYTSHTVRRKPPDCSFMERNAANIVYDPSRRIQVGCFYVQSKLSVVGFQYEQNLSGIFTGSKSIGHSSVTNIIKCLTLV